MSTAIFPSAGMSTVDEIGLSTDTGTPAPPAAPSIAQLTLADLADPPKGPLELTHGNGYVGLVSRSFAASLNIPSVLDVSGAAEQVVWVGEYGAWKLSKVRDTNDRVRVGIMARLVVDVVVLKGSAQSTLPGLAAQAELEAITSSATITTLGYPAVKIPPKLHLDWTPLGIDNYKEFLTRAQKQRDHILADSANVSPDLIPGVVEDFGDFGKEIERAKGQLLALEAIRFDLTEFEAVQAHMNRQMGAESVTDDATQAAKSVFNHMQDKFPNPDVRKQAARGLAGSIIARRRGWFE